MPNLARGLRGDRGRQGGAALIVFATVLIMGVAWFTVGALGKAPVATAEREFRTGLALREAKQALLAYIAKQAAETTEASPGRFPCPEHPSVAGTANAGIAAPIVGVPSTSTCSGIGRLPWRTLGINQIRDGHGEPLWYIVPTGTWALSTSATTLVINPGLAAQLRVDVVSNAAVALIVAPGVPVTTMSAPGAPASGCVRVNQNVAGRNTAPIDPVNFLECANSAVTTPGSYSTVMTAPWSNDRVIAITANEVMDAIAGPVADRLQRQVAPAMYDYYNVTSLASWGQRFFPNASTFGVASPETNNMCGNVDVREGMPPTITVATSTATGTCNTNWTGGGVSGLAGLLSFGGCSSNATRLRCDFTVLLGGIVTPRISATAPSVGYAFRRVDPSTITIQINGGAQTTASTANFGGGVSTANGSATMSFDVAFPLLSIFDTVRIRIPHPTDALVADTRSAWYINNGWDRFTYYGVSQAATSDPGASVCNPGTASLSGCLTVNGMTSPYNVTNDKRLVLVLMGRALAGQAWPSTDPADYLDALHSPAIAADNSTDGDRQYTSSTVTSTFNDRVAACPFKYQNAGGTDLWLCGN